MNDFMQNNVYLVGVNYWASHASIRMWSEWDAEVVDADFARLAAHGITHLRVFPLWPDFQPLKVIYANEKKYEYRMMPGEQPLPDTEAGRAGVSETACAHFAQFCRLAEKHGLKLIVGLLTGHMSFRFFAPEAFAGMNFLSDPTVIKWEIRFVRYFVRRFREEPSIIAWDLGNECNCMRKDLPTDQAYVWTACITAAIRESDRSRPIVSGLDVMPLDHENFNVRETAELVDVMTTHPYQIFSSTSMDPLPSLRPEIEPSVRAQLYESLSGCPTFVEETGSIGYMNCSEKSEAEFLRSMLFSTWAEGNRGLFWWCAFDQGHLDYAPYDWNNYGSDYGLFRSDGSAKPTAEVTREFAAFLRDCPAAVLPPRMTEAVCIVSRELQDPLKTLIPAYILAKQANLNLRFCHAEEKLPDAPLYIFPSVTSAKPMFLRRLNELLARVREGASLYLSMGDTLFRRIPELTGLTIASRRKGGNAAVILDGESFAVAGGYRYEVESVGENCTVLASMEDGTPAFVCNRYGKGKIYFLSFPLERQLADRPGAFAEEAVPYRMFYEKFAPDADQRAVRSTHPSVLTTEHEKADNRRTVVAVNYGDRDTAWTPEFRRGWRITCLYRGEQRQECLFIPAHDAAVFDVEKKV